MATKKEIITKEPTIAIVMIEKDALNDDYEKYQYVGINGKNYHILRGEPVEVPIEVAKLLKETGVIVDYICK